MADSQEVWTEKKAVGNIAESVVEFLINSTPDWKCIKYGMENHIDELKKAVKNNNEDRISRRIRTMPDFIAINKKTNKTLLIDVKFRSFIDRREPNAVLFGFGYTQIKEYLEFWPEASIVVVTNAEPYFIVIQLKDVEWHKHFHSRSQHKENLIENWNFAGIQKSIKEILPELSEKSIKKAIEMIPKKISN